MTAPSLKRLAAPLAIGALLLAVAVGWPPAASPSTHAATAPGTPLLAAPGLVEPFDEERTIGAELVGIVKEMRVEENERVVRDQILAVIGNAEIEARLAQARAQVALDRANLDKLVAGARPEEKREARALLAEAEAQWILTRRDAERRRPLAHAGVITPAAMDQTDSAREASEARRAAAAERLRLLEIGARPEDIAAARARLAIAEANVAEIAALLDKTIIRAPIDGVVLRRWRVAGEAVGNQPPSPIVTLGDVSRLRVRAEVDETDIAKVAVGQRVRVVADAVPGQVFHGTIARVSRRLGAKVIETGRAAEKVDAKVLQTLIDLDPDTALPVGLRVDVFVDG